MRTLYFNGENFVKLAIASTFCAKLYCGTSDDRMCFCDNESIMVMVPSPCIADLTCRDCNDSTPCCGTELRSDGVSWVDIDECKICLKGNFFEESNTLVMASIFIVELNLDDFVDASCFLEGEPVKYSVTFALVISFIVELNCGDGDDVIKR